MNNVFNCRRIETTGKQNRFPERRKETFWIDTAHCLSTKLLFKQRLYSAGEMESLLYDFRSQIGRNQSVAFFHMTRNLIGAFDRSLKASLLMLNQSPVQRKPD